MKPAKPSLNKPKPSALFSQKFEMSRKDKEPKGMKEGSRKEEKYDAKQMKKGKKC